MPHETNLIATVVAGFVLAFAFGFVAKRLRISPIVGYLLAGIAVGPHTPGFVSDAGLSLELAEIGVILLMFGVGLHFSIGDLLAMRRIALPGAVAQIGVATAIGAAVAVYWGWSLGAGLVFGLALSVASTVVLIRALEDRDLLRTVNGRIAVGWLVVEDFAMVIALVLLPPLTRALSGAADGVDTMSLAIALAWTVGKAAVFIALALIIGKRAVPWLLTQVARAGSRELFTLFVLATALGIAYASSTLFGVSFALGAFFAGVILSGSDLSYRASAEMLPLQDAFAVLFFVSVGMLFNFWIVISEPLSLLVVVLIILLGKSIAAFAIVLAFRYPIGVALTVSASLAQIGEFSFILAGLGTVLGVLPPEGRDLILAGALLSIALNPLAFSVVAPVERWLHGRQRLMRWIGGETTRLREVKGDATADLRDHAVIVGYGRVGSVIGNALETQGMPFVIVERDRRLVDDLVKRNLRVIYGDASQPYVLRQTHIERARLLIIAAPDGLGMGHLHREARRLNPNLDTVVRTHSDDELVQFERDGAGLAVMGERELALRMTEYSLLSLGLDDARVRHILQALRS